MTRKGLYEMSMYTKARVIKKQTKNHKKSIQNFYEGISLSRLPTKFFPFEIVCTFDSEAATRDVHSKKISKILQILQEKCYAEVSF